jgi:hypothetical protein
LADGLAIVVGRIGHHGHRTLFSWNAKLTEERNYTFEFSMLQDALMNLMFYVRFKPFYISNIHSSVTAENRTYVHMTFLTRSDLRNKILKY